MKFPSTRSTKFSQKGSTLTETILAIGVGAFLAALAYGGYKMATGQVSAGSQSRSTITLIGGIKRIFGMGTDYSTVNTANVINSQLVPNDFKVNGTSDIYNAWGGTIVPAVGNQAGGTPVTSFKLTVSNVPKEQCIDYVSGVSSAAGAIWVGGTTAGTHDAKPMGAAFIPDRAATQCAAADTTTVIFVVQ